MKSNLVTLSIVALVASTILGYPTAAVERTTTSCSARLEPKSPAGEVFACMEALEARISELNEAVSLSRRVKDLIEVIPTGAVLPFDLARGCPKGWSDFKEAEGRFLLGVGKTYGYRRTGGKKEVTLQVEEMPSHSHKIMVWQRKYGGDKTSFDSRIMDDTKYTKRKTLARGGNQPHNNMPPYIALYFCKKD